MFDLTINGEAGLLQLSGEVDLQSTSELRHEMNKLAGLTRLEIRAGDVSYIDSSGVAILLLARKICNERNIHLTISVVSQALFRVLEIARLNSLLPIGEVLESPINDQAINEAIGPINDQAINEAIGPINDQINDQANDQANDQVNIGFAALDALAKTGAVVSNAEDDFVWSADDPSLPGGIAAFEARQSLGLDPQNSEFDSGFFENAQPDDAQTDDAQTDDAQTDDGQTDDGLADSKIVPGQFG